MQSCSTQDKLAIILASEVASNININKIMQQCYVDIAEEELAKMLLHSNDLITIFRRTGQVPDSAFDAAGIMSDALTRVSNNDTNMVLEGEIYENLKRIAMGEV